MKPIFTTLIGISALLLSCGNETEIQKAIEPPPVDSFTVSGIDVGQQSNSIFYINDSTLSGYDLINKNLAFFHKQKNGNYKAAIKKEIDTEFWSMHFRGDDGKNYFTDRDNTIIEYNATADTILKQYSISHHFKYLKDSFALALANETPILKLHDTIIAVISPNSNESARLYYKEQEVSEFKIDPSKNTISYIRSYITKPTDLADYDFPMGSYAFHNNTVFLIYPQYDTIYSFNRSTNILRKTAIHNRDFNQPAKFTCKAFTPEYGSCATKYYLKNFRYYGIYFNKLTKHFLIFYYPPVKAIEGRVPTPNDQHLHVVVLDEQLRTLNYYNFTKHLLAGGGYFMIPGKGLAIPILDEKYETTRFYIYNL